MDWSIHAPDNQFTPPSFSETGAIKRIHAFPRFGYPSDIKYVANTNPEVHYQYFYGLLGPDRTGILSGSPPYLPYPSRNTLLHSDENGNPVQVVDEEAVKEIEEWQYEYQMAKNQMDRARIFFIMSSTLVLIASIVIYMAGLAPLEKSFIASKDEVADLQSLIITSRDQMQVQYKASNKTIPKRDIILDEVVNWCANIETNFSVSPDDITLPQNRTGIILDSDGKYVAEVDDFRSSLEKSYSSLSDMIAPGAQTIARTLDIANVNAQDVEQTMSEFIFWYGLSMFFIVLIDAITLFLLAGVYLASRSEPSPRIECIQTRIFLPVFTLLISASWFMTAAFAVAAVFSADVCTGSPESNIVAVFYEKEQTMDPLLYSMTQYYVESCMSTPVAETSKPTKFIDDFKAYIDDSIIATEEFVSEMKTINSLIMDENCGESIDQFSTDLIGFTEVLHEFGTTVSDTASSLYCSYFTPTYANIMHDQVCYRGVESLWVILIMLLLITTNGMVMITFRVALKAIEFEDEDSLDDDGEEGNDESGLEGSKESASYTNLYAVTGISAHNSKDRKQLAVENRQSQPYPLVGVLSTDDEIEISMLQNQSNSYDNGGVKNANTHTYSIDAEDTETDSFAKKKLGENQFDEKEDHEEKVDSVEANAESKLNIVSSMESPERAKIY